MTGRRRDVRKAGLAVVGLVAMLAFAYSPVLRGELLAGRDVFRIFFPDSAFLLESLRAGELPLWTPYLRLGQPFAATLYSQVFYPPRWVAVLVALLTDASGRRAPEGTSATRGLTAPAALAATSEHRADVAQPSLPPFDSTSELSKEDRRPRLAAASVARLPNMGLEPAQATDRLEEHGTAAGHHPSAGSEALSHEAQLHGVSTGSEALSHDAQLHGAPTANAPPRSRDTKLRARGLAVARVIGGFILSAVLASVALLPTAEFARNSLRSQRGWAEQLAWSVSWPQVLSSVWPLADWPRDRYWGEDQWFILNLFLGTLPCALAIVGGLHGPRRARPFVVGALALVMLSLGRHFPPSAWVLQSVPPFSLFRYPAKYFVGAAFCLAVLSAFGLDALGRLARKLPPSRLKAALAFVAMGAAIAAIGPVVRMLPMRASAEAGAPWVPFALGLATLILFLLPWSFARPRRVRHGLAALAVLELAAAHSLLGIPKYTSWDSLRQPFSLRALLPQPFQGRISADIEGPEDPTRAVVTNTIERSLDRLMPNRFVEERLPALEGYGAPEPMRSDRFHLAGERSVYDLAGVTHYLRQGPPPFEDLELLHRAEDGTTLSRSRTALPRAFLVQRARVVTDDEALEAVLDADQPFREIAFLASGEPIDRPECEGSVRTSSSGAQHLALDVRACDDSYLIVSDSYYPGWRATVDDKAVPIHRAYHSLRAVRLSPGEHHVRFDYTPLSFRAGLLLSLLGWVGLGFVWLKARRRPLARA